MQIILRICKKNYFSVLAKNRNLLIFKEKISLSDWHKSGTTKIHN